MKRLVWILLLLNVLVFGYFKLIVLAPQVSTLKPELHPEQVKLLNEQSLDAYARRAPGQHPEESLSALAANTGDSDDVSPPTAASSNADESKSVAATPELNKAENSKAETMRLETAKLPSPKQEAPKQEAKAADKTESKPNGNAQAVSHVCYEWGSFNLSRINEAVDTANQLGIKNFVNQQAGNVDNTRYWIYKPPLASAEAAQTKADELRKLGVEDFFVVQDPKWRNAISFGVFRDEKLADKLMADLKAKGVRLLIKSTRYGGQGQAVVKLIDVSSQQFSSLKKTQPQFPDSVVKEITCP